MTVSGMVRTQVIAIWLANPQRTILTLSADPAPTMEELITWVVLTGPPANAAPRMTAVLAIWDEKA